MKNNRKAFTLIELLVVIGIIALLLSIAMPAYNMARLAARKTVDAAALNAMGTGLESFHNDLGYYPDSNRFFMGGNPARLMKTSPGNAWYDDSVTIPDQGANKLFEALVGLDYLGYEEHHYYAVSDGNNSPLEPGTPIMGNGSEAKRYGPYIKTDSVKTKGLSVAAGIVNGDNDNKVFVDSVNRDHPRPILYYKAHTSGHAIDTIYNYGDNYDITTAVDGNGNPWHPQFNATQFYNYIGNPKTTTTPQNPNFQEPAARPYNPDSFLLINAGPDGQYGTTDDIVNFQRR